MNNSLNLNILRRKSRNHFYQIISTFLRNQIFLANQNARNRYYSPHENPPAITSYTINPIINAPFFLTPPSNKRPPKNQKYFINASLFLTPPSNKRPLQPASILTGNNRHDASLRLRNLGFLRIGVKCLRDKKTKQIVSDHFIF